jgi:pyridoxamine 5'-phosphate oxidase
MAQRRLDHIRRDYQSKGLNESAMMDDPMNQFDYWLDEVLETSILDPLAATLATISKDGSPSARVVLVKEVSENGFVFYTHYHSKKAMEIHFSSHVCLNFHWDMLNRQVRITGVAQKLDYEKSDAYFQSRPRETQLMTVISPQSSAIENRHHLDAAYAEAKNQFDGHRIPCPEFWGGYVITPYEMEFWQGRESRLHDRILYTHHSGTWKKTRLAP